jgi:hypothetical protein
VKALQAIHSHEDPPPAGGLHHGAQLQESFQHLFLGSVIVGRVRLQEGKGRTEGDGLGDHLSRSDSGLGRSL